jgi:hypothetical protein
VLAAGAGIQRVIQREFAGEVFFDAAIRFPWTLVHDHF